MTILELFSGTGEISAEFRKHGFESLTIDWNEKLNADMHCDIGKLELEDLPEKFRNPDVVWIAPDCMTFSLAAISHHRIKNKETGNLDPISDYAKQCDETDQHVLQLLKLLNPKVWWIENPRACLQKMTWMKPYEKYKHTVTYCKYMTELPLNERRMKATNLWTNIPNPDLIPPCNYGDSCHPKTPRGSRAFGTQAIKGAKDRSTYPIKLIEAITNITIDYLNEQN